MDFHDVVRRRKMVRDFQDRPVPAGAVDRLLAAARRGPSAGFTQGVDLLVLDGPAYWEVSRPADGFRWPGLLRAPVVVVVYGSRAAYEARYAEPDKPSFTGTWPAPWWTVDASFAAMLLLLAAVDEGLGACFFAVARPAEVAAAFRVPDGYVPVGAVAIGYPAATDRPSASLRRGRRSAADVVHRGGW